MSQVQGSMHPAVKFYQKKWFKITATALALFALVGGIMGWKAENILNKISKGGIIKTIIHSIPGVQGEVKGEKDGRINILLLGMRGENVTGGGLLADTIILASIKPQENKVSMISIPRDLYVTVPGTQDKQKINAVHFYGEQKGKGQGLEAMKEIVGEITGLPIHYASSINFAGFEQLVDAIGGIEINLEKPFEELLQFNEPHVCDSFFTIPTGTLQDKTVKTKSGRTRIVKSYPLCTAPIETLECGGEFRLPAGQQTLSGEKALCYVRSRTTSSDFERAKRQQVVIQLIKDKLLSVGTLTDFEKIGKVMNSLGDNVRSDMELWEMKRLFEIYKQMASMEIYQRVLENSEEGLLYHPEESNGAGYILLPIGDNYDRIHNLAQNIFTLPAQKDIKPR